ncbi:hypothetical protein MAPG_07619 [Magnaporthiopsis poae ATCC 64411]|uniref:Uncharacterized protein n=1 Tax=Magnaporthiopsis poae (strain ATCC 64411 / 73-15) TaxID=644358 RepID=A0A0C4E555_MAGP6|nr:hypothetical protein MAPG_07619 [Magnaporthiopsis poae ATCC 64411]
MLGTVAVHHAVPPWMRVCGRQNFTSPPVRSSVEDMMDGTQCLHLSWSPGHLSSLFGVNAVLLGQTVQASVPCTCSRLSLFSSSSSFRCFILGTCRRLSATCFSRSCSNTSARPRWPPPTRARRRLPDLGGVLHPRRPCSPLSSKGRQWHATPTCLCIHPPFPFFLSFLPVLLSPAFPYLPFLDSDLVPYFLSHLTSLHHHRP